MARIRRHLKELAADPRFISGVYNYCDRWCERCPLTSRCLVYAMEQAEGPEDHAARDIRNQAFWRRIEEILREANEILDDLMAEHGIALEPLDAEAERTLTAWRDEARDHPSARAASEYAGVVDAWLAGAETRFRARGRELESQERMGLRGADPAGDARRLADAAEVIRWYQHQIVVKIIRAVGAMERERTRELALDQRDADGSAKVALLGIDRSLAAWSELLRQMPDEEDRILPTLAALSRLRREIETAFPNARAFVRPGFDTGEGMEG
jgi:hypothetical protein